MTKIIAQLEGYIRELDMRVFFTVALMAAGLTWANYQFDINGMITRLSLASQVACWYTLFFSCFAAGHALAASAAGGKYFRDVRFLLLLILAPLPFALKMAVTINLPLSANPVLNSYWNTIAYWPLKLAGLMLFIHLIWLTWGKPAGRYGLLAPAFPLKPYAVMLLFMVPLIAAAATQPDFLEVYPKVQHLQRLPGAGSNLFGALLFEISYGSDFIGIEFFFRGFLVLAFAGWAGKDAILPMAIFYCTIHFGKPAGECISSFFGGIILGVVTYHSRSIWGGLLVHLGIAWLMEAAGYLGNLYKG